MRGGALTHGVAFGAVVAVALAASVWSPGAKEHPLATWPMIGHDVENSRSQPDEGLIKRSTVDRLSPAWTFVTGGDVSATPAVDVEQDESGRTRTVVYFPDWGGNLWKLDADSKQVVWTRLIGSYNGIAGSISRTSPALHDGMLYVGDLRGNMMGIDAATGELRWLTRLDPNPNTIVTASPVILGHRLFTNTSSSGGPPARLVCVWDFAGSGANVFTAHIGHRWRRVVGIGQKSGVYWTLDAATGQLLWSRLVGPGSDPGGIQWGTAVDGHRIYAAIGHNTGQPYALPSGEVITGGSWAALDTRTGRILWRFAAGGSVVGGPAVVDGAVYWGSGYARTGGVGNDKFYVFRLGER